MEISLLTLLFILITLCFSYGHLKTREKALSIAHELCHSTHATLLDGSVHLYRLRLKRKENGWLGFQREFHFDYSTDGQSRYRGRIILLGAKVVLARLDTLKNDPMNARTSAMILPFKRRAARNEEKS